MRQTHSWKKKSISRRTFTSCRVEKTNESLSRRMRLFSTVGLTQLRPWTSTQGSRRTFWYRRPPSSRSTFARSCSRRFCRSARWTWLARWLLLSAASLRRISTPASRIERSSPRSWNLESCCLTKHGSGDSRVTRVDEIEVLSIVKRCFTLNEERKHVQAQFEAKDVDRNESLRYLSLFFRTCKSRRNIWVVKKVS